MITFDVDGKSYVVSDDAYGSGGLIALPDGRLIRPTRWIETYPVKMQGFSVVPTFVASPADGPEPVTLDSIVKDAVARLAVVNGGQPSPESLALLCAAAKAANMLVRSEPDSEARRNERRALAFMYEREVVAAEIRCRNGEALPGVEAALSELKP